MPRSSRVTSVGLFVRAILVVMYALIMFASLLLVGVGTTRTWRTAFLGMGWSTIAEFEIGLLGVGIVGFAAVLVLVPVYSALRRAVAGKPKNLAQARPVDKPIARYWQVRLLTALLVLRAAGTSGGFTLRMPWATL